MLRKAIFTGAVEVKRRNIPILASIADIILGSVRAATGGRLRLALSGGAAVSPETQEFLTTTLVTMLQGTLWHHLMPISCIDLRLQYIGYGMTETCGMCAILPPELMSYGPVGLPVPSVEVKLLDAPDAGYLATNKTPQGEICIRGPSVTQGYYKRPDLNNDPNIFIKGGWLRTGDIGQWNADGTLSIIDRYVKTSFPLTNHSFTYHIIQPQEPHQARVW
jgi:long-chain acyl-CoA synthetase